MNWLHYLLEANLYLAVFYAGYYLFLSRETYYTLNRIYLLFSCIASFALPVIQLGVLKPVERPITAVQFTFPTQAATTFIPVHVAPAAPVFTWQNGIVDVYLFGAAILLVVLLIKLYQLLRLTRVKNPGTDGSYKVIHISESDTAFSFFNYLFIGTKVQQAEMIIKHELVHIKQKHSADIIFTELLKIVNWFNPFIYLLQYSLREIHEYIADEKIATSGTDTLTYSSFLVSNAYGLSGSSITHSFFNYNLLKKRIIMLHQKRSGKLARLRYLLVIPICGGLLCASTLAFSKTYAWVDIAPHRINPANKSAQVAEPKNMLVVVQNGKSLITDKFSGKRADGSTRIYTVHNLSNKDREDLKKQGISIDVVTIDTDKTHTPPPPPPAPPVKQVKFPPPIVRPSSSKGYPYTEAGYMENGKSDIKVTIYEKNGSHKVFTKSKATPEEIALLKDKYGYVFPAHLRTPPPPPAPPKSEVHKFPPPVIRPDHKVPPPPPVVAPDHKVPPPPPVVVPDHKTPPPPAPAPPVSAQIHKMPPPPPLDRCFFPLYDYMAKTLKYPADPKKNRIVGNVVVSFKLDADHKITDVKLVDAGRNGFDEEVINTLKSCTMPIIGATPRPYYMLGVSFNLVGDNTNFLAKPFGPDITNTENYACVVQLNGYTNN